MSTKDTDALEYFRSGMNCAQTVLKACTDELKIDEKLLLDLSCGFGGGMGRLQETCGAVTGAYMALGIHNGKNYTNNAEMKESTYLLVQQFSEKFKSLHGATDCKTLLNCNLSTPEGRKYAHDHHLFEKVCEKCITSAVTIVEEMLKSVGD